MHFTPALTLLLATLALAAPSPAAAPSAEERGVSPRAAVASVLARHLDARNCECFDKCSDGWV
jgi:hypothetical protein